MADDQAPLQAGQRLARQRFAIARKVVESVLAEPKSLAPFLFRRVIDARINRTAAALSFSTALAMVPALALLLAMLAAFPAFDDLRNTLQVAIVTNLVPDTGLKISEFLATFINTAGQLTIFGVIGLMFTAIFLLLTVEGALNEIFRVARPRPLRNRILAFWSTMTIGPILLGLGATLLGYFTTQQVGEGIGTPHPAFILLGNLMPTVLTWATLAFLFTMIPNRRLKLKDTMIGAAVAALLLAALRYTFAAGIIFMTSYKAIYGALAAVPVFLLWAHLVWLAVLSGAVVTAALPDWRHARLGVGVGITSRLTIVMEALARLGTARRSGMGLTTSDMAKQLGVPDTVLVDLLNDLRKGNFVACAEDGRWLLARDLERTTLSELLHHFELGIDFSIVDDPRSGEIGRRLNQYLKAAAESERTLLSISLARIIAPSEELPAVQA